MQTISHLYSCNNWNVSTKTCPLHAGNISNRPIHRWLICMGAFGNTVVLILTEQTSESEKNRSKIVRWRSLVWSHTLRAFGSMVRWSTWSPWSVSEHRTTLNIAQLTVGLGYCRKLPYKCDHLVGRRMPLCVLCRIMTRSDTETGETTWSIRQGCIRKVVSDRSNCFAHFPKHSAS